MKTTEKIRAALMVLVLDPKIRAFLAENDPMALKQAREALAEFIVEDVDGTLRPKPEGAPAKRAESTPGIVF